MSGKERVLRLLRTFSVGLGVVSVAFAWSCVSSVVCVAVSAIYGEPADEFADFLLGLFTGVNGSRCFPVGWKRGRTCISWMGHLTYTMRFSYVGPRCAAILTHSEELAGSAAITEPSVLMSRSLPRCYWLEEVAHN